ncbi:MAG: hypothetical protein ABSC38_07130 [Verrucomicrobiia bacterium]
MVFTCSMDLRRDYIQYYSTEYGAFSTYLDRQFYIPDRVLSRADLLFQHYQYIIYFVGYGFWEDDKIGLELLKEIFHERRTK